MKEQLLELLDKLIKNAENAQKLPKVQGNLYAKGYYDGQYNAFRYLKVQVETIKEKE